MRFRRWRVYGARGLPDAAVAVWLYAEYLTPVCEDRPLAQHWAAYQPKKRHLKTAMEERVYETPRRSPPL